MDIQACIPVALTVVHNFICCHEPVEDNETNNEDEDGPVGGMVEDGDDGDDGADGVVINEPDARRDAIASTMWNQYLQKHVDRGLSLPSAM